MDAVQRTQVEIDGKTYTLTVGNKPINFKEVIDSIGKDKIKWPDNKEMNAEKLARVIISKLLKEKNIKREEKSNITNITISADNFNDFIFDNFNEDNLHYIKSIGYKIAADNGYVKAQCNYGFCLKNGKGVKQDVVKAVGHFKMAADNGYDKAQYNYGVCLYNGKGVGQNLAEAARYYLSAIVLGHEKAKTTLKNYYKTTKISK